MYVTRRRVTFSSNPFPPGNRLEFYPESEEGELTGGNDESRLYGGKAFEGMSSSNRMNERVPPIRRQRAGGSLVADAEFDKNLLVPLGITIFQVNEETTPLRNHTKQTSP
jgi:hypothetical protein